MCAMTGKVGGGLCALVGSWSCARYAEVNEKPTIDRYVGIHQCWHLLENS